MSTKTPRASFLASFPVKREKKPATRPTNASVSGASASGAADRLAALTAADMPWLSKDGLATLADAPELSGPPTYKKPADWR